ncbi:unnamed protein product [Phytophthora lilii]|uniref:Unnamed protein product n=1 Tax=Phytophthora lilii TaxID=2077276 RepID=A0A9W6U7D7_9STRA|nr:unnamed protein product [Phytophthora lilii]
MVLAKMRSVVVSSNKIAQVPPSGDHDPSSDKEQGSRDPQAAAAGPAVAIAPTSFIIAYFLIGIGYLLLTCCIAEINGALPFAGGAYGLARCTLGFYPAFMIGCCDTTEYIVYVSVSVITFAELMVEAAPSLEPYHPLIWTLFYVAALLITIKGDRVFWTINYVLGVLSLVFLLLFCFGSLPYVTLVNTLRCPNLSLLEVSEGLC